MACGRPVPRFTHSYGAQDGERGFLSRSLRSAGLALLTADARFFVK